MNHTLKLRAIGHASDLRSPDLAFEHALALALAVGGGVRLSLLHALVDEDAGFSDMPGIRETLSRWGRLTRSEPRAAVADQCGIRAKKVLFRPADALESLQDFLRDHPVDLLAMQTGGRQGLPRWLKPSFAERLARASRTATLFVPENARGFVDRDTGALRLARVLVPVDETPSPREAIAFVDLLADLVGPSELKLSMLHGGETMPDVPASRSAFVRAQRHAVDRDPVPLIIEQSERWSPDLIVMTTAGHHGIFDALRGSVTEQVLRQASCPVLTLPATG